MKRTQLYMEEDVWKVLEVQARDRGCTISELVRQAVREKYLTNPSRKREVLKSVVGLWRDRKDLPNAEAYVRGLRKGERLRSLHR